MRTSAASFTATGEDAPVLKILLNVVPLSTFTSPLPCKGDAFNSHTWDKGYFTGSLISPKVDLASIPSSVSSEGAYTKADYVCTNARSFTGVTHQNAFPVKEVEI